MKNCFVSIPYGQKPDYRTGDLFDFDRLYWEVIKPAVDHAGIYCFKDIDMPLGFIDTNKNTLSGVIHADIMIADITTANPNVFYELGVRHALRNETTIVIMNKGSFVPSFASYIRILTYDYNEVLEGGHEFRYRLAEFLKRSAEYKSVDSPLYEMFEGLRVELPAEPEAIRSIRSLMEATPKEDESVLLDIEALKELQRKADYPGMIEKAESLSLSLQKHPEIRQLWAMALMKRRGKGDYDRAIEMMQELIAETGGDTESYSILGSIYKRRYQQEGNIADLDATIDALQRSYDLQPSDYYTGVHLLFLLFQRDTTKTTDEFNRLLPEVTKIVEQQLSDGKGDFWSYSSALELSCISADWSKANKYIDTVLANASSPWMLESLIEQFYKIMDLLKEEEGKKKLAVIIERLKKGSLQEGHPNA